MRTELSILANKFADWLFRRRSPALVVMRIGLGCLTLAFAAGLFVDISLPLQDGRFSLRYTSADGSPAALVYAAAILGLLLILVGVTWEIIRYRGERSDASRKRIIVVEGRGLRDTSGTPLVAALPAGWVGRRDQVLIDIRQRIKDGVITDPTAALTEFASLAADLKRREQGLDRNDIAYVYGGLTPVPFTFLTGVVMDDEGAITLMDWDRHRENWRSLDGIDDNNRFVVSGLEFVDSPTDVALVVAVSYGIALADVRHRVGSIPLVQLQLTSGSPDSHWSEVKQAALGQQFLDAVVAIKNSGARCIHLFLAAQNSVVFRFGRLYDKRNLPEVIVYQYQRGQTPAYAWGLKMPVAGSEKPEILA